MNVAYYYGNWASYSSRVPRLAKARETMRASVIFTQESGPMSASDQLCRAFGDQFENVNRPSSAVHGGLNNAIIYDYTKDQLLEAYHFATVGPHHNNATGCIFRDKVSGIIWAGVTTHPENLPDGSNKRHTSYDDRREQQVGSALRQMVAKVDAARVKYRVEYIPLILGLDANGDRNDAYDGPGRLPRSTDSSMWRRSPNPSPATRAHGTAVQQQAARPGATGSTGSSSPRAPASHP